MLLPQTISEQIELVVRAAATPEILVGGESERVLVVEDADAS
jgi:hypothetical protein